MLAYSISHALAAKEVDRVIVSTNSTDIAAVAMRFGAEVIMRPEELSGDKAQSEEAVKHVLGVLSEEMYSVTMVVMMQATSPFRTVADVDGLVRTLREASADSCFSVLPEHFTGRFRMKGTKLSPINYEPRNRPMRQDYPMEYLENGNMYAFYPIVLETKGTRIGNQAVPYEMDTLAAIQMDTMSDLSLVRKLAGLLTVGKS